MRLPKTKLCIIEYKKGDSVVRNGLSQSASDLLSAVRNGEAGDIKMTNSTPIDGSPDANLDEGCPAYYKKGVDMNDLWQLEQDAKMKINETRSRAIKDAKSKAEFNKKLAELDKED